MVVLCLLSHLEGVLLGGGKTERCVVNTTGDGRRLSHPLTPRNTVIDAIEEVVKGICLSVCIAQCITVVSVSHEGVRMGGLAADVPSSGRLVV